MNFPLEVAKRYLRSKKSTHAINYISRVTGLAMFFGTLFYPYLMVLNL